jgi:predicted nucleotidyltransferase
VEQAILYGSRANRSGSDIDLTLRGGADLTLNVIYKILNDLDELLLPYTIHLFIFDDISDQDVIAHIQRVGVVFYKKGESDIESSQQRERGVRKSERLVHWGVLG